MHVSLVETEGFRDFIYKFDPSFTMPTRKTIKSSIVPSLKEIVFLNLKKMLKTVQFPNISVDGWSDVTARPFNGYTCQGIDDEWKLRTMSVDFRSLTGNNVINS